MAGGKRIPTNALCVSSNPKRPKCAKSITFHHLVGDYDTRTQSPIPWADYNHHRPTAARQSERMSSPVVRTQDNPFRPGRGVSPPCLAGREFEQERMSHILRLTARRRSSGQEIVLIGPRGSGKTVLLNWLESKADEANFDVIQSTPDQIPDLNRFAEALAPPSRLEQLRPDELAKVVAHRRSKGAYCTLERIRQLASTSGLAASSLFGRDRLVHFPDAWIQAGRFAGVELLFLGKRLCGASPGHGLPLLPNEGGHQALRDWPFSRAK